MTKEDRIKLGRNDLLDPDDLPELIDLPGDESKIFSVWYKGGAVAVVASADRKPYDVANFDSIRSVVIGIKIARPLAQMIRTAYGDKFVVAIPHQEVVNLHQTDSVLYSRIAASVSPADLNTPIGTTLIGLFQDTLFVETPLFPEKPDRTFVMVNGSIQREV